MASERILTELVISPTVSLSMISRVLDITDSRAVFVLSRVELLSFLRTVGMLSEGPLIFCNFREKVRKARGKLLPFITGNNLIFVSLMESKCTGHTHAESCR